jgi:hypothetical protein
MAERARWWPSAALTPYWYEAHAVLGSTMTAPRWAVASGAVGGADKHATYALISNTGATGGNVNVTLARHGGAPWEKTITIAANARYTFDVATEFAAEIARDVPQGDAVAFGLLIESALPLIVERSHYASPKGLFWSAGDATLGTPVPAPQIP